MTIEARIIDPGELFFRSERFEIPKFQRRYVWGQDEQWEPLWEDLENCAQAVIDGEDKGAHFMGAIVLRQKSVPTAMIGRRTVVDGQQRLTTLQLLIRAIQEVLEECEHTDAAARLAKLVLNDQQYRDSEDDAFKVWPTVFDRQAFKHVMSNHLSSANYAESRIARAHDYFKDQARRWLDDSSDAETMDDRAKALEMAVSKKLQIVVIDLESTDDPHVIFETLNARGTPLLQSDMVKNSILHDTGSALGDDEGDDSEAASRLWPFDQDDWWAKEVGRGMQRRPRIDVYLNHWLTLRNQREMKPYDEFPAFERYANERERSEGSGTKNEVVQEIATDLSDVGDTYREVEQSPPETIARFVSRCNVMGVRVITPLLLWLLDADLPQKVMSRSIRALESFLVRRVICGYSARSYGGLFVELIQKLAQNSTLSADQVLVSHLSQQTSQAALWPRNQELLDRFKTAPLYQMLTRGRLRMVLEGIEENLRTTRAESGEVPSNLHIEHIMPQAWHPNWPLSRRLAKDAEAIANRDRALHTIGNLTLVNGRLNSALSNAPWDRKKVTLADHSVLFLNKRLVNDRPDKGWDETEIERRAKWLHKQAAKVWPHSDKI